MNKDQLMELYTQEPEKFFSLMEETGSDINESLEEVDLGRQLIRERFKGDQEVSDEQINAAQFVLCATYFVEKEVENMIIHTEVNANGESQEKMEKEMDNLSFGQKINHILRKEFATKDDPFVESLWEVKKLRDHVAHCRWSELVYKGYPLSDKKGQLLLMHRLMHTALG